MSKCRLPPKPPLLQHFISVIQIKETGIQDNAARREPAGPDVDVIWNGGDEMVLQRVDDDLPDAGKEDV